MATTTLTWATPGTLTSALTTELNSLANAAYSAASAAIDNLAGKHTYIVLELVLASLTPTGSPSVSVYLLPSVDDTNYVDGGGAVAPPEETYLVAFTLSTSAGAKLRGSRHPLPIPPLKFRLVLLSNAGPSLAASGNTLKFRFVDEIATS